LVAVPVHHLMQKAFAATADKVAEGGRTYANTGGANGF